MLSTSAIVDFTVPLVGGGPPHVSAHAHPFLTFQHTQTHTIGTSHADGKDLSIFVTVVCHNGSAHSGNKKDKPPSMRHAELCMSEGEPEV